MEAKTVSIDSNLEQDVGRRKPAAVETAAPLLAFPDALEIQDELDLAVSLQKTSVSPAYSSRLFLSFVSRHGVVMTS